MLLTGKNPYKETYFGTPVEEFKYSETSENPALYHLNLQPFYLLSAVPFYFLEGRTIGFFDGRLPMYLMFFGMLVVGFRFIKDQENKLLFITLMTFNPMTLGFLLEGRSDMYMYPILFLSFVLLHKNKLALASVVIAISFAIKQNAWPLFPLFAYFLYIKTGDYKQVGKYLLIFLAVFGAIVLPFFAWDPKAFLDSTLFYITGSTQHSFPISGYGFGTLLHELGFIKDLNKYYPFIIWQIIFAVPLLLILFKLLKRNPNTRTLIFVTEFSFSYSGTSRAISTTVTSALFLQFL
jgi:uncharacterized membrane protein